MESLEDLPFDVLLVLFSYCDVKSLGRLAQTCKRFKDIIYKEDGVWFLSSSKALGSNMAFKGMFQRCKPILTYRERCKVSVEWCRNCVKSTEISLFKKCKPWTLLEQDHLYLSYGRKLVKYIRNEKGSVRSDHCYPAVPCKSDIEKFAINSKEIICGGSGGRLTRFKKHNMSILQSVQAHDGHILAIDSKEDLIISGSRDTTVKIWKCFPSKIECQRTINVDNVVLSTTILPLNMAYVVGTIATESVHPLQIYLTASGNRFMNLGRSHMIGVAILDIFVNTPYEIYSCGSDATLRLWDVRCPMKNVAMWTEPFDNALYCVQSDLNVTVVTGSCQNGCSWVYDKRITTKPVKGLYITGRHNKHLYSEYTYWYKGPVFSLAFDASHVFVAADKAFVEFSHI